jgi:glutathione S-transferase
VFGASFDADEVIGRAHAILTTIDAELEGQEWIAASNVTIADIALYSYIARAPEGNVDLSKYPNVLNWLKRIEALPGFVEFGKTSVGLEA